ncbi:MAG: 2-C-methyl-D-erythritol 4-phosphate cytidylyltransferase [Treponema sp.]|nr:2-C-methyl-D-erythritol 4-phosphate cytidylyltransferase [Treponema sp.]
MTTNSKKVAVIITAAGSSTRMGGGIKKEYLPLGNGTVLSSCVNAFVSTFNNPQTQEKYELSHLIVTVPEDGSIGAADAVSAFFNFDSDVQEKVQYIQGGATRQISVFNGMNYLRQNKIKPDIVLIHDGARPFVTQRIILDVTNEVVKNGAAVPVIPVTDTIKEISDRGIIRKHMHRKSLAAVQTPQGFDFSQLLYAHLQASTDGNEYTDDSEIFGNYCGLIKIVPGDIKNIKITYPGDLEKGTFL